MNISAFVYFNIVIIGSIILFVLSRFKPVSIWKQAFFSDKLFLITSLIICCMLFWPNNYRESAFSIESSLGANRYIRIIAYLLIFAYCSFKLHTKHSFIRMSYVKWYIIYIIVCFLSAFYSPFPEETLWKSFELLLCVTLVFLYFQSSRHEKDYYYKLVHGLTFIIFALVLFSLVGILIYPELSRDVGTVFIRENTMVDITSISMGGIIPQIHPNTLSQLSGIIFFIGITTFYYEKRHKNGCFFVILVGLLTLLIAHSRTSIIATIIFFLLYLVFNNKWRSIVTIVITGIIAFVLYSDFILAFILRGQDKNLFLSMSGRSNIWSIAYNAFIEDPLLGKGFYSGHKSLDMSKILSVFSNIDNTYLESLVNVGVIGTFFLITFAFTLVFDSFKMLIVQRRIWSTDDYIILSYLCIFESFVIFRSFAGPSYQIMHINLFIMLVSAAAITLLKREKKFYKLPNYQ
ncbi:O-antigen ligase family protein [Desulforegula conservatrix]|uniref:O-antigen ligase family protein n=1 Tax=Desulforegula conservatrix TaxID=153026 RepID=UPI0004074172|nr:O-antigen ligase family protein [Desulforegula conservatrix]